VLLISNAVLNFRTKGNYIIFILAVSAILLCIWPLIYVYLDNNYWHKNYYGNACGIIQSSFIYGGICVFMPCHILIQLVIMWFIKKVAN
jgi:hypothetical protein